MINCHHCGKSNLQESNFCRYCGSKFAPQPSSSRAPQLQRQMSTNPLEEKRTDGMSAPRPYAWKTDEYEVRNQNARETVQFQDSSLAQYNPSEQETRALASRGQQDMSTGYRCPRCASTQLPYRDKRISTAGWIVFAALLLTFFPLFWLGFFIKEEILVCPVCNFKMTY